MSRRILVIEDNDQNRYLVKFILEKAGYTVVEACDGFEGISQAMQATPDLVLLDIQLPLMDGYAVAAELQKIAAMAGVPIVAVTSYAMASDREQVLASGCTGYIEKPINPTTFLSQIKPFLRKDGEAPA